MKTLACGTFDILHIGHLKYLKYAKEVAKDGTLTVIVSRDINAEKLKGKPVVNSEDDRLEVIQSLSFVDEAVLGTTGNIFDKVKEINPDVLVLGYDQNPSDEIVIEKLKEIGVNAKVVRAYAYKSEKAKSSKILQKVLEHH